MLGTFSIYDTSINFHKDGNSKSNDEHYKLFEEVFEFMKILNYKIKIDPEILKHYECIAKDHFYGKKINLEFKANRYPAGFKIEFFQNINIENKSGGYYDFNKFKMMPYIIRLQFENDLHKIIKFLESKGLKNTTKSKYKLAEDKVKQHFVGSCHHQHEDMDFKLTDLDGQTFEDYNSKDRDKKILHNGEIKYFRDCDKYLCRGKIYHNTNNMWWVIINDTKYTNVASFELFDLNDEDRKHKGKLKTIKKYMNPKNIEYKNQEYRIEDNIFVINCRTGLFKANTDFGSYQYYWSARDNYKDFIIDLDKHYFLEKMSYNGKKLKEVDIEKTLKNWKEKIIEMRKDGWSYNKFDKDKARELWDFIDEELDDTMSSETLQRYMYDKCNDLDIEEPWYIFDIEEKYKDDVEKFYKLFCQFQEILKKELEQNKCNK